MEIVQFKKALFIENDWSLDEGAQMHRLKKELEKEGVICDFVGRAFQNLDKIERLLDDCDAVICASTFLYTDQIIGIVRLLKDCKSKVVIIGNYSGYNLSRVLKGFVKNENDLMHFDHHKVYEMVHYLIDDDTWLKPYDMSQYRINAAEEARLIQEKYNNIPRTGKKIIIRKIQPGIGKQWATLKEGDVVDQLEYGINDPRPGRGVWVWGASEPVKLVNDDFHDEWAFHEPKARDLAVWIGKATGDINEVPPEIIREIELWIQNNASPVKTSDGDRWFWITETVDILKIPRRHYRTLFNSFLTEYGKRYHFFKE